MYNSLHTLATAFCFFLQKLVLRFRVSSHGKIKQCAVLGIGKEYAYSVICINTFVVRLLLILKVSNSVTADMFVVNLKKRSFCDLSAK